VIVSWLALSGPEISMRYVWPPATLVRRAPEVAKHACSTSAPQLPVYMLALNKEKTASVPVVPVGAV
jgi:hypothetical protein